MTLECPKCGSSFGSEELKTDFGYHAGIICPRLQRGGRLLAVISPDLPLDHAANPSVRSREERFLRRVVILDQGCSSVVSWYDRARCSRFTDQTTGPKVETYLRQEKVIVWCCTVHRQNPERPWVSRICE
jgi:hypothetical protein